MTTIVAIITTSMNILGIKIKEFRSLRDWTQNDLAKRSGVDRGTLASIESGKAKNPTTANLLKLARAFSIRPEELYQAAGYIEDVIDYKLRQESPEEILDRLRLAQPVSIPVFSDYPFHAGQPVDPVFYVYRSRPEVAGKNIEGYLVHGKCLEPVIQNDDIIIVDREREIDNGDIIACLIPEGMLIARLRKIAGEVYLENNEGRIKFDECQAAAPVIEVIRKLK